MGQCLSVYARRRRRGKVRPLLGNGTRQPRQEVARNYVASDFHEVVKVDEVIKVEKPDKNSVYENESEAESVGRTLNKSCILDKPEAQDVANDGGKQEDKIQQGDQVKSDTENVVGKSEKKSWDESHSNAPEYSLVINAENVDTQVILVRPATDASFSFGSRRPNENRRGGSEASPRAVNQVPLLDSPEGALVRPHQRCYGEIVTVMEKLDVEELSHLPLSLIGMCDNTSGERSAEKNSSLKPAVNEEGGNVKKTTTERKGGKDKLAQRHLATSDFKQIDQPERKEPEKKTEDDIGQQENQKLLTESREADSKAGGAQVIQCLSSNMSQSREAVINGMPEKFATTSTKDAQITHRLVKDQLFEHLNEPKASRKDDRDGRTALQGPLHEKYSLPGQETVNMNQEDNCNTDVEVVKKSPVSQTAEKCNSTLFADHRNSNCVDSMKEDTKNSPFWTLRDVAGNSLSKPARLTYEPENTQIKTEMKNIESEMAALLKPEEKFVKKTSVAFTLDEGQRNRARDPGCVPKRFVRNEKCEVDQARIHEKQREADRRRKENIAKRIQSARRRASAPTPEIGSRKEKMNQDKTADRMENAIVRREQIIIRRIETAQKSHQLKKDVVKSKEDEAAKAKERVMGMMDAATLRRNEIINRRVQAAMKSGKLRRDFEEDKKVEMLREKEHALEKLGAAASRRNEILIQRVEIAKKANASRSEVMKEDQMKKADVQQQNLDKKMQTYEDNRERMLRKTVRWQEHQERRRELARKRLARMKRLEEEELLQFVEVETYEDDSDCGETAWRLDDEYNS